MTIYKGSQKEGKVYKGGTKIGKVYKGSQLVYQSTKKIQLYAYGDSRGQIYLGGYNTTYGFVTNSNASSTDTLNSITGTLGASGSKIKVISSLGYTAEYTYEQTLTYNGIKVFCYYMSSANRTYVLEGSIPGSTTLNNFVIYGNADVHPTAVTSNTMTTNSTTLNRYSPADKIWTINGVY